MPALLFTTLLALSALYAPQPLLPVLTREFGVSATTAALLTTSAFLPLALAPLVYGLFLERVPARRLLKGATSLMAASEFLFYLTPSFGWLLVLRLIQGALIPALLTALMTEISSAAPRDRIPRVMGIYIAVTIAGGFLGRAVSGLIATTWGWRDSFLVLGISFVLAAFWLARAPGHEAPAAQGRLRPGILVDIWRETTFRRVYLAIFCLFLTFSAILNFLPFRLVELSDQADTFRIGLMYSGYLLGMITSYNAPKLVARIGGEVRTLRLGLVLYLGSLLLLLTGSVPLLFVVMFLLCGSMFLVHATASGYLNRLATARRGAVNGLYVSCYYGGGMLGSFLPGYLYREAGWLPFILSLAAVLGVAMVLCGRLVPPTMASGS